MENLTIENQFKLIDMLISDDVEMSFIALNIIATLERPPVSINYNKPVPLFGGIQGGTSFHLIVRNCAVTYLIAAKAPLNLDRPHFLKIQQFARANKDILEKLSKY